MLIDAISPKEVRVMPAVKNGKRTFDHKRVKLVDPKTPYATVAWTTPRRLVTVRGVVLSRTCYQCSLSIVWIQTFVSDLGVDEGQPSRRAGRGTTAAAR